MDENLDVTMSVRGTIPARITVDLSPRALLAVIAFSLAMSLAAMLHML